MRLFYKITLSLGTLIMVCLSFVACDDDNTDNSGMVSRQPIGSLGEILVDGNGRTLYFFTKDVNGQSACTAGCLSDWPVYYAGIIDPGPGIDIDDFSTITRTDGLQQTTYKGWPLYYYADDVAGEANGEGVGNVWFVAKPDYSIMLANAQLVGHDGKNYNSNYQEGTGETQYFVDSQGRTLYTFVRDYKDINKFTAPDLSNNSVWPIFHTEIGGLPSTLNADDFGEIEVYGNPQLTYKGNPLYYFGQDANRGENKGVSFPAPGSWPGASPRFRAGWRLVTGTRRSTSRSRSRTTSCASTRSPSTTAQAAISSDLPIRGPW